MWQWHKHRGYENICKRLILGKKPKSRLKIHNSMLTMLQCQGLPGADHLQRRGGRGGVPAAGGVRGGQPGHLGRGGGQLWWVLLVTAS